MVKEDDPISEVEEDDEESTNGDEEEEDDLDDEEEDEDEDEPPVTPESRMRTERARMEGVFHRISSERVPLRVHDVLIKGNNKTKESLIEAEIGALKTSTSVQELLQAATIANARLQKLDIFDSVNITLDSGPPELPGTSNVIVQVVESKNPITGDIGIFTKPEARSWSLEGALKFKNLFGYGDLWDGSLSYGWDQTSEVSAGVSLPRFMRLFTPVMARISLLSQDWLKFSSYKERSVGLSLGLLSTKNHDVAYNLSWRTLTDPSQMASKSIRRQLGHGLLSHVKYTFKIDRRNSPLRPTRGFAFVSASQVGGIFPDYRSLRFIRQEFDIRYALPLGFARAALNFGVAGGVLFPWGSEFMNKPTSLPDRFFLGGNSSPVCTLGGPTSLLGFKTRGLGPSEPKREVKTNSEDTNSDTCERDFLGGDLAATAFADLSFDLPLKVLRDANIHAHAFACAGSLTKLTENSFRDFSFQKYRDSFRCSAGFGLIVPTKLFRMEVNYCHILRQHEHDLAKTGVQFSFSSPL
ncbi:hypothetical protein L1987_11625 [Smallanthus sonchifolius]|uniref:Uncharacterized protein n=1 Tax=Smallanthus sonchifolius TaxID=185202 RepID=A0ACB9JEY0_9ASTR|nr:hypothetical protein L1987_11625 [Smallanthus sonchifolius]